MYITKYKRLATKAEFKVEREKILKEKIYDLSHFLRKYFLVMLISKYVCLSTYIYYVRIKSKQKVYINLNFSHYMGLFFLT